MHVTDYHDQLAGRRRLVTTTCTEQQTMFLIEFSRSEVDPGSLSNENKYHYPGIQNMYKKGNVEF